MSRLGTTALLAALMLGSAAGCASGTAVDPAAVCASDAGITAGVKGAVAADGRLQHAEIDVETREGIVQLSGYVSSAEDVATAAAVARTVKGVQSVRNDLRLR